MNNIGEWICDVHEEILGYSLTRDVMNAYIWLFLISLVAAFFTGGR